MRKLITVPEIANIHLLSKTKVRDIIARYELKPVEKIKTIINGFSGHPYCIDEIDTAFKIFSESREKPKAIKKIYTQQEICETLRKIPNHYLWNRQISEWSIKEWKDFEELKNN